MAALVVALRVLPLVVFAGVMILAQKDRGGEASARSGRGGNRAPLVASLTAFGVWGVSLVVFGGRPSAATAPLFAASGCLLALAGVAIFVRSRAELGLAWSFGPRADRATGLVTTGPYRLVRHPIYLGLTVLSVGEALACASWPSIMIVVAAIVPTLVWRARAEERLLERTFGAAYDDYRARTGMIVPRSSRVLTSAGPKG
jgi:protein-S-isoprenylcysteine O-methyltransferase Ste14